LVCCDYDGTVAPIVDDPGRAAPLEDTVRGLRALALLPATTVAVVSGRALRDLAALSRLPAEVHLVGSHGSEFDLDFVHALDSAERELLARIVAECSDLVRAVPGAHVEVKPAGVTVHVRRADPDRGRALLNAVREGPARVPGVYAREGKQILELSVVHSDKAEAVALLRHRVAATAVIFIGDDVTDESVFMSLSGPDVSVKVGEGATAAGSRLAGPEDVARLLAELAAEREDWLLGGHATPIEDHLLLSDRHTVALLDPRGSVSWMCAPEPDSPALFASLLGDRTSGVFTVEAAHGDPPLMQAYLPDTMIARTRWAGLTVVDYLDGDPGQPRLVRAITGSQPARITFAPRPQFGTTTVMLTAVEDGVHVTGSAEAVVLSSPGVTWSVGDDGGGQSATAVVMPPCVLELRFGTDDVAADPRPESDRRQGVVDRDRRWLRALALPGVRPDAEARAALTLRALTHESTGAILAAATTSLPESMGGVRNWDYRYCWIRDAALSVRALVRCGSIVEAEAFIEWLHRVVDRAASPERLHPLYTLHGRELGPEATVESLPGYAGSRPVRVGNAAQGQVQLDVFGPVVALIHEVALVRGFVRTRDWDVVLAMVDAVTRRWNEADHGIWEIRDRPRHHIHSRMMCWLALDRAVSLAEFVGDQFEHDAAAWCAVGDEIRSDIETNGFDEGLFAYVAAYDRRVCDAAVLQGFAEGYPAPMERRLGTIAAIERELRTAAGVYRYHYDDGLPGYEGAMHICAAWLAVAYAGVGEITDAVELLDALLASAGPTGLLPEQVDPLSGAGLGNHPQAYSHLGVLAAGWAIAEVRSTASQYTRS
jgi:trehalose-phosphatase